MLAAASIRIAIAGIETRLLEIAIKMPVAATIRFCETKPTPFAIISKAELQPRLFFQVAQRHSGVEKPC